jgi:hypothetical protein
LKTLQLTYYWKYFSFARNYKWFKTGVIAATFFAIPFISGAQKISRLQKKAESVAVQFAGQVSATTSFPCKFDTVIIYPETKQLILKMNEDFSNIPFREENTKKYYADLQNVLWRKFKKYTLSIETMGREISMLIPNYYRTASHIKDNTRLNIARETQPPLVQNISGKTDFTEGLYGRNIALWHSHGWYYENTLDRWEWQRSRVFQTVEDIWTMSFVVPYITPMLENAGANVLIPRERDTQLHEIIVDGDGSSKNSDYIEKGNWQDSNKGFGLAVPFLFDGENPFTMGKTRRSTANAGSGNVEYIPDFPETGLYSVSVSYGFDNENVSDAHYTVYHAGGKTDFKVNQQIGGGTWIYLGTFQFEKGKNDKKGKVELTSLSNQTGRFLSADAVKFGGGMGNIVRGQNDQLETLLNLRTEKGFDTDSSLWIPFASGRPRYQEAARYYLQYAGMPDSTVYSINRKKEDYAFRGSNSAMYAARESGKEDYKDDYMSRGEWVNYLMGSEINPRSGEPAAGLNIPIDMALAFHTDAGVTPDSAIIGILAIYNTTFGADTFPSGQSKWASRDLSDIIQTQVSDDLRRLYEPQWTRRGMWNKQYSEAFRPKVPTMLSELLSHQNFADMALATDPRFKFDVGRAYYKGILRFLSTQNGTKYTVQPLPVSHFQMQLDEKGLRLYWHPVADPLEPSATPTSYRIYTRIDNGGFDNGFEINDTSYVFRNLEKGVIYSFKITAVNNGGESFPSEILACSINDKQKPVLIVNAFDRICAPAVFDNGKEAGFNNAEDEGVAYLNDIAFIGNQYDFDRSSPWKDDDASGFGSSHADHETRVKPGNTFDYPFVHGRAIRNNGGSFISMSDEAFETKNWDKNNFAMLDIIFGEEKTTRRLYGNSKPDFTLFTQEMRSAIEDFTSGSHAKILISGAYIGTDLELCGDTLAGKFASSVLHFKPMTNHASKSGEIFPVNSVKTDFPSSFHFEQNYNPKIYEVESPDAIEPVGTNAKVLFRYAGDHKTAAVGFNGDYQTITFGFPFETITTDAERDKLMGQIFKYFGLKE